MTNSIQARCRISLLVIGLAALMAGVSAPAAISVIGTHYRQDVLFPEFDCFWNGGGYPTSCPTNRPGATVYVYIKNTGGSSITVNYATLAGYNLETVIKMSTSSWNPKEQNSIFFYWDNPPQQILDAGEPIWWKADPPTVPVGGVAQITVRMRQVPTNHVSLGVVTSSGSATTNITVDANAPRITTIGYSEDRKKIYIHWRRNGGAAPASVWLNGTNVTAYTTTVGDSNLNFAASVISLSNALPFFSYHVYQGVYADGKTAAAGQRVWTNKFIYTTWSTFEETANYTAANWLNEAAAHGFNNVEMNLGIMGGYMGTSAGRNHMQQKGYGYTILDKSKLNPLDPDCWFLNDEPELEELNQGNNHCGTGLRLPCNSWHYAGTLVMKEAVRFAAELRALRPNVPTTVNLDGGLQPQSWYTWGPAVDVLESNNYYEVRLKDAYFFLTNRIPLYNQPKISYAVARSGTEGAAPNPFRHILYSCKATDPDWPYPFPNSKRIEAYYSLAGGSKGMGYWWFNPPRGLYNAAQAPALWKEIGLIGNEIKTVRNLIVVSTPVDLPLTHTNKVWARAVASGADTLMLYVANDNYFNDINGCHITNVANVSITATLPTWMVSSNTSAFEITTGGKPADTGWSLNGSQLEVTLGTVTTTRLVIVTTDANLKSALQARYTAEVKPGLCTFAPELCTNNIPSITLQPSSTNVCAGGTAIFRVQASGSGPITYQWQKDSVNLSNGGHYSGVTTTNLTVSSVDSSDAANYRCVVSNAEGGTNSSQAALTVKTATAFTQHPVAQSVCPGATVSFSVVATGDGTITYQWQTNGVNISNNSHYGGATTATLWVTNVTAADQVNYRCVATAGCGSSISFQAALTIAGNCAPNSLVNGNFEGGNTGGVGTGWTGYQRAPNPTTVWTIQTASPPEGAQYQQIANTSSTGGGGVRQNVTGTVVGCEYNVSGWMRGNSANAVCTVKVSPTASTDWATAIHLNPPQTTNGSVWVAFSGNVIATGTNMTIWLDGQTTGTGLNKAECFDGIAITCVSATAPPTITQQPSAQNVCPGANATFSVTASGQGTLTYQWQTNGVNVSNNSHYGGATSATLWVTNVTSTDAVNYRCVVSNAGGSTPSSSAALTLRAATVITQQPSAARVCPGGTTNFTVSATGDGTLTYQWQKNGVNLSNGGHYSGVTMATLTISSTDASDAADYRCVVTGGCGSANSSAAALTVCIANAMTNADFEGGNTGGVANGWTGYQRAPNPTTVWSIQTASPPQGLQYQQIANTSSTGGGGVRQDITGCVVGCTYTISGWMRGNSISYSTCTVKVSPTASTSWSTAIDLNPPQTYTGNAWTAFSGAVVATSTNMTLWLDGQTTGTGQNKAECFDAITVTCAP